MSGSKVEATALDAAGDISEFRILAPSAAAKTNAYLIGKNLLGRPHFFERFGIEHLAKLGDQELVRENRKLREERARLREDR